ncbi:MAG: protein kinase, partial [Planctomycetota bacterium]|nr:protein kinase [Planctomycetota bacterium]
MPLTVTCPQCSKPLTCPDEFIGRQVQCPHCQSMVLAEDKQRLGNYTVVRKLGEGGMGAVYEGIQDGLNRRVALKLLTQRLLKDSTYLERFQREAQGAAALNHPNIVTVYEIGQDRGTYFFSMEFVDGTSLGNRISKERRLPVSDALEITSMVASALDYAWREAGLVHRDIKPDNIMLTSQGHIKVADLGLAKRITTDSKLTNEGAGLGTPHYMAPEQSQGARDVDCRADIYSLGITLYEMLTGKVPYEGATPYAVIISHLE